MDKITNIINGNNQEPMRLNPEQIDLILGGLEQKANYYLQEIRKPDNSWDKLKENSLQLWKIADTALILEGDKNAE